MNWFEVLFLAALSAAQKPIETCTKETFKCPITKEQWDKRYREFHCFEEGTNYTCLQAVGGILVEACSYPDIIEGSMGKCPVFYACDGTIPQLGLDANFNDCPSDVKGCPGKNHPKYTVNEMYKYPACITISWTELSTSTELTVKPETENDEHTTIYIVLPIAICVVIILTILGVVLWFVRKRKTRNRARLGNDTEEVQPLRTLPAGEVSIEESSQPLTLQKEDEKMRKGTVRVGTDMRSQDDPGVSILYSKSAPELPIPTMGVLTYREETEASLRDALLEIYNDEINRVRASPLQTTSNIPIHELYSPVSIREDLEYKYRGRKMGRGDDPGKNTKAVEGPDDIFKIDGKKAKNVFMIGDAGYGKSFFCLRLIHYWLGLVGEKNIAPNDEEWIQYLRTFDFIFLVRLRLLDMSQTSLASMICHDLFKNDRKFHKPIQDVLSNDDLHCLIIIDGLDEANLETGVLPTTEGLNNCTLFWTSLPWKLDEFSHVILGRDRVVEIHGLSDKGVNTFTENILLNHLLVKKESDADESNRQYRKFGAAYSFQGSLWTGDTETRSEELLFQLLEDAKNEFEGTPMSLCRDTNGDAVIIGYDVKMSLSEIKTPKKYKGQLRLKHPMNISEEGLKAAMHSVEYCKKLDEKDHDILHDCINKYAPHLWNAHSNLTMIGGDCVKYTRGLPKNLHCVVLYCQSKGFIPFGEDLFPKSLGDQGNTVDVDVREGYFQLGPRELVGELSKWNDPICMGSSIGKEGTSVCGSVGPFVSLPNNEVGFITCCHVLFDCIYHDSFNKTFSINDRTCRTIQPSMQDFCDKDISEMRCGQIKRAVFSPETSPVSVDAALVNMTNRIPSTGHFAIKTRKQLSDAGYTEQNPPLFSGGEILRSIPSTEREKPLIKSGTATGLTKGEFWLDGFQVRIADDDRASLGDTKSNIKRIMKGQYEVRSSMTFFDLGDSGSAVFLKEPSGSLKCVGIAIGKSSFNSTIVTPIYPVLQSLGVNEQDMTNFGEPMNFE